MKTRNLIIAVLAVACTTIGLMSFTSSNQGKQFMQITTIESVVPGGMGRSRMITMSPEGQLDEVKMENFFSMVGINFNNVRTNDQMISDKISEMSALGWTLVQVTPGVYASDNSTGIFITRYLFEGND